MTHHAEITFEIEETITLRSGETVSSAFCPLCRTTVQMASLQFAASAAQTTIREIFRLVEANMVHFIDVDGGLICLSCLISSR